MLDKLTQINDNSGVPIKWVFGLLATAGAVLMVTGGLVAWGARLESRVETKVSKEQYIQDIADLKSDVRAIRTHFHIKENE